MYPLGLQNMKRNNEEFKIHVAAVEHIRTAFPHVLFTHPAQKAKDKREGHFNKMMGVKAGVPDLLFWWSTNHGPIVYISCGAIELKSSTGRRSSKQGTFEYIFTRMGGRHAYCRSVREVHDALVSWGIKPAHNAVVEPDVRTIEQKYKDSYDFYKP